MEKFTLSRINQDNFEKYVRRQSLSRFLARYELFKQILNVKGSVIECGVHHGGGIMSFAKLSSALEPYAINRKIIGFDTFEGFVSINSENDEQKKVENKELKAGGFDPRYDVFNELLELVKEYDDNRYLNQWPKIELVKGDAIDTIPQYLQANKHLIIALLFMDFDLYEPTKVALNNFVPLMPKGSILAFDEINNEFWPGETKAPCDYFLNLNKVEIKKFPFDPNIAYIVL